MFDDLLPEIEKSIKNSTGSIPVVFKGMERQFAKCDYPPKSNTHEFHELLYMRSGKANFKIAGKTVLVEKGDTLVIRPGETHKVMVSEGTSEMLVLYFGFKQSLEQKQGEQATESNGKTQTEVSQLTLEDFIQFASGINAGTSPSEPLDPYLTIKGKSRQDIASIVERILRESKNEAYGKDLMMQFLAMELLVALSRGLREEWEENVCVKTGKINTLVRLAKDFIIEHHDKDITVADAAAYVFLSQGYFARAFRDETGISPMNFIMQVRVDHACRLLEQEDFKIGGIARLVGFASAQRFNAAFKKHMGLSPVAYRKQVLEKRKGK